MSGQRCSSNQPFFGRVSWNRHCGLTNGIRHWAVSFYLLATLLVFSVPWLFVCKGYAQSPPTSPQASQKPTDTTQALQRALTKVRVSPLENTPLQESFPLLDEQEEAQYGMQALCVQIRVLFRIADQALLQNHFDLTLEALNHIQRKQRRLQQEMYQLGLTEMAPVASKKEALSSPSHFLDEDMGYLLLPLSMRHPVELEGLEAPKFRSSVAQNVIQDVFHSTAYRRKQNDALARLPDDATVLQRFILTITHLQNQQSQKVRLSQHELEQLHILLLQQELSIESLRQAFSHPWIQAFLLARKAMASDATRMSQVAYLQEAGNHLRKPFFSPSLLQTLKRVHPSLDTQALEVNLVPFWQGYVAYLMRLVQQTHTPESLQQGVCLRHTPFTQAVENHTFIYPEAWLRVWLPVVRQARYLSLLRYSAFAPIMQQFDKKGRVIDTPYYQLYHQVMPRLLLLLTYNSHFKTLAMFQAFQNQSKHEAYSFEVGNAKEALETLQAWYVTRPEVLPHLELAWYKALKHARLLDNQERLMRQALVLPWVRATADLSTHHVSPEVDAFAAWQQKSSSGLYVLFERTTLKPNRGYLQTLMK